MRTLEAIKSQLEPEADAGSWQGRAELEGRNHGYRTAILILENGGSSENIAELAKQVWWGYKPGSGDYWSDYWQGGYYVALLWCAEQFDYGPDGWPVWHPGNILNYPAGPRRVGNSC